jgi:tetratricopeptide (TPR) repeat protein
MQSDEVYRELQENLEQLRKNKNRFSDEDEDAAKKKIADDNHPASEDGQSAELSAERPSPEEDENNPAGSSGDHEPPSLLISHLDESEEQPALDINQQKQNELIDRFINSKVDFTENIRSKSKTAPQEEEQDLLGSSVESSENLISENLADIMLRQGKTDKAIEIYKKLIWKYPQKKTYFAEKIDQIKAD